MKKKSLDLGKFKEPVITRFDDAAAERLYLELTRELSSRYPCRRAYDWVRKYRPKLFAEAAEFEVRYHNACVNADMQKAKTAAAGIRGAWLKGFKEYDIENGV